ncbi:MAG: helix-turn-helix domain-containing protein [Betaproteobacteria bacterium]|nr:helix-turn-helix domain-containing protein [Betaproteobacteria bacterium]
MDPNTRIGGPQAAYRKEQIPPAPAAAAPMRLARMLRLYVAATEGLTQKQVAQAAGVNESTVSRFLSGEQLPDGRAFAALLTYCLGEHGAP